MGQGLITTASRNTETVRTIESRSTPPRPAPAEIEARKAHRGTQTVLFCGHGSRRRNGARRRINSHRRASKRTILAHRESPRAPPHMSHRICQQGALKPPSQEKPAGGEGTAQRPARRGPPCPLPTRGTPCKATRQARCGSRLTASDPCAPCGRPSRCSPSNRAGPNRKKGRARLPGARPCRMTSNRRVRYSAAGTGGIS